MSDFAKLVSLWSQRRGERLAMATVVRTAGSTYRRAGARMLVLPNGETAGLLSGGCLESDIAQHAARVLASGAPRLVSYDTRVLLGCNGVIDVFIEELRETAGGLLLATAEEQLLRKRAAFMGATLFAAQGEMPLPLGSYPVLESDAIKWPAAIQIEAVAALFGGASGTVERSVPFADGAGTALLQAFHPPIRLVIFGSGPDAEPLAAGALRLGWNVLAIIHPSQEIPKLPAGCQYCRASAEEIPVFFTPDAWTAAVVMTHNYGRDLALLAKLLPLSLPYVGLLGPKNRRERLLADLAEAGMALDAEELGNLYNPAGLDIGAEGPEEIAFAIISEIKAIMSGRAGGSLRAHKGAIHAGAAPKIVSYAA